MTISRRVLLIGAGATVGLTAAAGPTAAPETKEVDKIN
jgi:hypothetical protein